MVQTRGPNKRKVSSKKELEEAEHLQLQQELKRKAKRSTSGNSQSGSTPTRAGRVNKPAHGKSTPTRAIKTPVKATQTGKGKGSSKAQGVASESPNSYINGTVDSVKDLEIKLNKITEQEILTANNNNDLVNFINQLTSTSQDEIFSSYKLKTKLKLQQDEDEIIRLQQEIKEKDALIQSLRTNKNSDMFEDTSQEVTATNNDNKELFISPIRKRKNIDEEIITREDINQEFDTMGAILDMVQLLTGMRVINYEEDKSQFYFDVVQNNTNDKGQRVEIEYKIIIIKKYSSATEVNYIPTFISNDSPDKELLLKNLPDYFCNNLTFPYSTLSQFYGKMNKALNKVSSSKQT